MKDEKVSLSEAARRLGITRQTMSEHAASADFPPTTVKGGRSRMVSWAAVQKWRSARVSEQAFHRAVVAASREFDTYRGRLWNRMHQLMGSVDCSLVLGRCYTVDHLRAAARKAGLDPDGL